MSESSQPYKAEPDFVFPETQVSCFSGMDPVEIKVTPPTPMVSDASLAQSHEDTHKEVIVPDKSAEEKQVCSSIDICDDKHISLTDEKEVHIPVSKNDDPPPYNDAPDREAYSEKEVFANGTWGDGGGKEVVPQAEDRFNKTQLQDMSEKEIYVTGAGGLENEEDISPIQDNGLQQQPSTESGDSKTKRPSIVQRKLDNINQAVEIRKKAMSTFTSDSNTRLREGYARFERRVTDSGVAIEQGTNDRYKRLEKGITNHITRMEQGTTMRVAHMERGINDRADRAGKSISNKVANLKQGVDNLKKLGTRLPGVEGGKRQTE